MRKKTKIITTISDRNCEPSFIADLFNNGMNVVRINTAHQNFEGSLKLINNIREVSDKIAILIDTKGPEVRTIEMDEALEVKEGELIAVKGRQDDELPEMKTFYVNYENFVEDLEIDAHILIDDGSIDFAVREKKNSTLICEVLNDGIIEGRKSVNTPSIQLKLPSLTQKDIDYVNFAIDNDLDFIAHSFVRNKEDLFAIQKILDERNSTIEIISKIENQEGVDNLDEILDNCYGIMIARGDLAIEIPAEKIPTIQKAIVKTCIERRKPVIVATQMLHSMIHNPRPTRAEVSDVANSVYDGVDAIMLSGETAYGAYPVEAVKVMTRVAREVEKRKHALKDLPNLILSNDITAYNVRVAVNAAEELPIKAIIADTTTGRTIRALAAYRGRTTIYAQCYDKQTMRKLALSYGVYVDYMKTRKNSLKFLKKALQRYKNKRVFHKNNMILVIAGNFTSKMGANFIEIGTVKELNKYSAE